MQWALSALKICHIPLRDMWQSLAALRKPQK